MNALNVIVIGAGPAGLMAADRLSARGHHVHIYDRMPSVGRKFLMAGKSGLNLSHTENFEDFRQRYFDASDWMHPLLETFGPAEVRAWADGLGAETFVGSSGRIFPAAMKASPLLRAWLARLKDQGCAFYPRHDWQGINAFGGCRFNGPEGDVEVRADRIILALGGASWPRLGSNAAWVPVLRAADVQVNRFKSTNCGFDAAWSRSFTEQYAGVPVKNVVLRSGALTRKGDFVIASYGVEGSTVYAVSRNIRQALEQGHKQPLTIDLMPDWSSERLRGVLSQPRGKKSLSTHIRRVLRLDGVKMALLRECTGREVMTDTQALAAALKALPIPVTAPRPVQEAISSAGGVALNELDERLMLKKMPGVYAVGEMLDWEAPTGGYLITACLSQGAWVADHLV